MEDLQGAHSIECDPDDFAPQFIELPSQHFKTASMLAKKLHFLPITALVFPFQANLGFIITFKHVVIWGYKFLESYRYPFCQQELMPTFHMNQ
jgi:hypothetical protein